MSTTDCPIHNLHLNARPDHVLLNQLVHLFLARFVASTTDLLTTYLMPSRHSGQMSTFSSKNGQLDVRPCHHETYHTSCLHRFGAHGSERGSLITCFNGQIVLALACTGFCIDLCSLLHTSTPSVISTPSGFTLPPHVVVSSSFHSALSTTPA